MMKTIKYNNMLFISCMAACVLIFENFCYRKKSLEENHVYKSQNKVSKKKITTELWFIWYRKNYTAPCLHHSIPP